MGDLTKSGYKCLNVTLLESTFKRSPNIDFIKKFNDTVDINTGHSRSQDEKKIFCTLELKYESFLEGNKVIEAFIKMAAIFEKIGEAEIDLETFGKINGPAIIFPYVREHLSSLSVKAGVYSILLPPINFVAVSQINK